MNYIFSDISRSLSQVFQRLPYIFIVIVTTFVFLSCMVLMQNIPFMQTIWNSSAFSFSGKLQITAESLYAFNTNLTRISQVFHVIISFLVGTNIALLLYYYRARRKLEGAAGISLIGVVSGVLGIGCSVCGSVILSSIFGLTAATAFITLLPMRGLEFSLVGTALLLFSIGYLGVKLQQPVVCKTKK